MGRLGTVLLNSYHCDELIVPSDLKRPAALLRAADWLCCVCMGARCDPCRRRYCFRPGPRRHKTMGQNWENKIQKTLQLVCPIQGIAWATNQQKAPISRVASHHQKSRISDHMAAQCGLGTVFSCTAHCITLQYYEFSVRPDRPPISVPMNCSANAKPLLLQNEVPASGSTGLMRTRLSRAGLGRSQFCIGFWMPAVSGCRPATGDPCPSL